MEKVLCLHEYLKILILLNMFFIDFFQVSWDLMKEDKVCQFKRVINGLWHKGISFWETYKSLFGWKKIREQKLLLSKFTIREWAPSKKYKSRGGNHVLLAQSQFRTAVRGADTQSLLCSGSSLLAPLDVCRSRGFCAQWARINEPTTLKNTDTIFMFFRLLYFIIADYRLFLVKSFW